MAAYTSSCPYFVPTPSTGKDESFVLFLSHRSWPFKPLTYWNATPRKMHFLFPQPEICCCRTLHYCRTKWTDITSTFSQPVLVVALTTVIIVAIHPLFPRGGFLVRNYMRIVRNREPALSWNPFPQPYLQREAASLGVNLLCTPIR